MLGQEDTTVVDSSRLSASQRECSFACKPLWQRMAIVAAGPIANFLLAIFVFWLINISYGVSGIAPVVNSVIEDSIAEIAGLRAGDEILAVDGEETIIWQQVTLQLLARLGETGEITLTVDPADSSRTRELQLPINAWMGSETAPNPVGDLGIIQFEIPADIAGIVPGGAAEAADLQEGDEVISVDGRSIRGWTHWVEIIRASPELTLNVVVQRGGISTDLLMTPETATLDDGTVIGSIGAYVQETTLAELLPPEMQRQVDYNVLSAIQPALAETWNKSIFVLDSVKKMVVGLISVKNINGPITIAQVAGETATYGLDVYLGFLALLSISLGVLNLLPIPVLDGGHLLYYAIEAVIRRPVPERIQAWGLQLGLLMISGLMVLAMYNDVNRLL
jgi:regulator of sigma E protease